MPRPRFNYAICVISICNELSCGTNTPFCRSHQALRKMDRETFDQLERDDAQGAGNRQFANQVGHTRIYGPMSNPLARQMVRAAQAEDRDNGTVLG